jgi:hypothetical protein
MESSDQYKTNSDVRGRKRVQKESNWKKKIGPSISGIMDKSILDIREKRNLQNQKRHVNIIADINAMVTLLKNLGKEIFSDFWNLGSWDLQTSFLNKYIITYLPRWQSKTAIKSRKNSCTVLLKGNRVFKKFFLMTLDISVKRFDNVAKNKTVSGVSLKDKRGKHEPQTKFHSQSFSL